MNRLATQTTWAFVGNLVPRTSTSFGAINVPFNTNSTLTAESANAMVFNLSFLREQISIAMKKPVNARKVKDELRLLRGVMRHANLKPRCTAADKHNDRWPSA